MYRIENFPFASTFLLKHELVQHRYPCRAISTAVFVKTTCATLYYTRHPNVKTTESPRSLPYQHTAPMQHEGWPDADGKCCFAAAHCACSPNSLALSLASPPQASSCDLQSQSVASPLFVASSIWPPRVHSRVGAVSERCVATSQAWLQTRWPTGWSAALRP
mmetsp:Transcript_2203/g.6950  ORF Transcript_2203/g.6950 Transcript_2203/m.6950 type:complete len:162 (+) Transcript_2203:550-1035(+)|eukprot:scaffold273777_cov39-Tisochrysis_lutea.AAC.2